ncbi:imelysin family protein [Wenyingzhuangia sp. IMCC45533]
MKNLTLLLVLITTLFVSCNNDSESGPVDNFNRTTLLNTWVNNIIIPSFEDLSAKLTELKTSQNNFSANPSISGLQDLREKTIAVQKVWQHVAVFEFRKAEELNYRLFMNSFPVDFETSVNNSIEDDDTIKTNLQSGKDVNFLLTQRADEQGLPALDYLLNGLADTDASILALFTAKPENTEKSHHLNYLEKVIDRMISLTNDVQAFWIKDGASIAADGGSSAGSSLNKMINDYIVYVERAFREAKIATPSGKRDGVVNPSAVESFYSSENSKLFYLEAFKAVQNVYFGNSYTDGTEGIGIDDYLIELNTIPMGKDVLLNDIIKEQLDAISEQNTNLENDFVSQIKSGPVGVNTFLTTFNTIQEYVLLLKVNTLSATNIAVDTVDSDGD